MTHVFFPTVIKKYTFATGDALFNSSDIACRYNVSHSQSRPEPSANLLNKLKYVECSRQYERHVISKQNELAAIH
jgi:hypothetical protein